MSFSPHIPSLLALAFMESGLLVRDLGGGFFIVRCPWQFPGDGHAADTVFLTLTVSPHNYGMFFCKTCGHKDVPDVLGALPRPAVLRACMRHGARLDDVLAVVQRSRSGAP